MVARLLHMRFEFFVVEGFFVALRGSGWLVGCDSLLTPSAKSLDCVGRFSLACNK